MRVEHGWPVNLMGVQVDAATDLAQIQPRSTQPSPAICAMMMIPDITDPQVCVCEKDLHENNS